MVKVKNRYMLVQLLFNDDKKETVVHPGELFKELMTTCTQMHGDLGNASLRSSLNVKVADGDVFVIRVESSGEKYLASALPFVVRIGTNPLVVQTLFVGRSMRSCEKRLLQIRRNEIYRVLPSCTSDAETKVVLQTLAGLSARIKLSD